MLLSPPALPLRRELRHSARIIFETIANIIRVFWLVTSAQCMGFHHEEVGERRHSQPNTVTRATDSLSGQFPLHRSMKGGSTSLGLQDTETGEQLWFILLQLHFLWGKKLEFHINRPFAILEIHSDE